MAKEREKLIEKSNNMKHVGEFKYWTNEEKTDLFYTCFGHYVKEPNAKDMDIIYRIWSWSCHADIELQKSILYAFKWAKLDLMVEYFKWNNN